MIRITSTTCAVSGRSIAFVAIIFFMLLGCRGLLQAQNGTLVVYPPELYPGENTITVSLDSGIQEIRCAATSKILVNGCGGLTGCPTAYNLKIFVPITSGTIFVALTVIDCNRRRYVDTSLELRTQWDLDKIRYGSVEQGTTICREFRIRSDERRDTWLDSITVADPNVTIELADSLPIKIKQGTVYFYTVCYQNTKPGEYEFPVVTWMRRAYSSGGLTTYAVADTGDVIVTRKPEKRIEIPPPQIDTIRSVEIPPTELPPITDPTTFRSVAIPNGVLPAQGRLYVGSYDLLGLTAGYAITDNLMILAGGALPTPDDWGGVQNVAFGAWSIGVKGGFKVGEMWHLAAGYQWGESFYDRAATPDQVESRITFNIPYIATSYGNDRQRISLTAGYALKQHRTIDEGSFNRNALFLGIGGDYTIGRGWKVAGEFVTAKTLGTMPIIATLRYFTDRFAIDGGIAFLGIITDSATKITTPVVPVVSGVYLF